MTKATKQDPAMQGEGNYTAARRHRKSVQEYLESNDVERDARDAAPQDSAQKEDMRRAEKVGKSHARK